MNIIDLATKTMQVTILAAVNGIKTVVDTINNRTATIENKIGDIGTNIGTLMQGRTVKSVQRGISNFVGNTTADVTVVINISAINPSKTFILIDDVMVVAGSPSRNAGVILDGVTSNSVTFRREFDQGSGSRHMFSYQVVEYY